MIRRRAPASSEPSSANAAATDPSADADDAAADDDGPPKAWHAFLSVRVVLVLGNVRRALHLFLWWAVYDIWRGQDHARLRTSVSEAIESLNRVWEHL